MVNQDPRILSGRYEVGELIGRGGMAEVHIGHDSRLGRTVAIKILRSDLARDPSFQVRFRREAQAAASLNHPAIVAVYDTGEDTVTEPGGATSHVPFIVMEYVEGHTVRDVLQDGSAVPIEEALEITAGILSALEYSHNAGIVHRDIKPANVMLTPTGAVKVMDFGIARALADSAATMTQTQAVIGTAQYLSPEQARGDQVDTRSDLYSTGCLLFELLTGRPPFTGDSPVAVAYQHVRELPKSPSAIAPDVPANLDAITLKALEKDREDRYSTAAEFRADIEAAARGEAVDATKATRVVPVPVGVGAPATQVMPQQPPVPQEQPDPQWQDHADSDELLPDTEDEPTSSKKNLLWGLLGVALLAALVIAAFLLLGGDDDIELVTMPDLTNSTVEQAKQKLLDSGITAAPDVRSEASIEIEKDAFIRSDPQAGEAIEATMQVVLWFSLGPDATSVPDVTGMSEAEAIRKIEAENLTVARGTISEQSPDVPANHVTKTDPEADSEVEEGSEVTLHISDGYITIPDITDMTLEEAEAKLDEFFLKARTEEEVTTDHPEGSIIRQSPSGGDIALQKSTVTITIAVSPPPVEIPDLKNHSSSDAEKWLTDRGLTPVFEQEHDDQVSAGNVISSNPGQGAKVEVGGSITLVISKGPEPTPDPEPTDTSPPPNDDEED